MKRRIGWLAWLVVASLVTLALAAPTAQAGPSSDSRQTGNVRVVSAAGPLTDLQPAIDNPTDGVTAATISVVTRRHTVTLLHLRGFDRAVAGQTFGAHVHTGPCVAGNGAAAGPHFNIDVYRGVQPPEVSPRTEVWLDFTVTAAGTAHAASLVPFAIPAGAASSIVVHEHPTDPTGAAGGRLACIGVQF